MTKLIEVTIWSDDTTTERLVDDKGQGAVDCPSDNVKAIYYKYPSEEFDWYKAVRLVAPHAHMGDEGYRNAGILVDIYLEDNDNPTYEGLIAWVND
jgi:hypothetical protein